MTPHGRPAPGPTGHGHDHAHRLTATGRHRGALTAVLGLSTLIAVAEIVGG